MDGPGVAETAIKAEFGNWPGADRDLGKPTVIDGSHGRGTSGWIPVLEWTFDLASKGLAWTVIRKVAGEIRAAIETARAKSGYRADHSHRVLVSRGLAVILACAHIYEETEEREQLRLEVAQEPTILSGNRPTEISYTGIEPWIVLLVNDSLTKRYMLTVSPHGEVLGYLCTAMDKWETMFYRPGASDV